MASYAPSNTATSAVRDVEQPVVPEDEAIKGFDVVGGEAAAVPATISLQEQKRAFELGIIPFDGKADWNRNIARAVLGEFLATAFFLFNTITTVQYTQSLGIPGVLDSAKHLIISLQFGLSIFVLVYMFFGVSGGHINPAVTFSLMLGKRVSAVRALLYIIAQMAGATFGAACARAVSIEANYNAVAGGANALSEGVTDGQAFLGEVLCTALLCLTVLAATTTQESTTSILSYSGALLPFAIGMTVAIDHFIMIPIDGCSINPARSFGASLVANVWTDHYLFWVGPLCGSAVAILLWEGALRPPVSMAFPDDHAAPPAKLK